MAEPIYRYVWRHTRRQQIWMLCVVLASIPTLYVSLDLPKQIINGPIQGEGFENADATLAVLRLALPGFLTGGEGVELFGGFQLDRMEALFALSSLFLALVVLNGGFKFYLNIYKGRLGERMLRRLRFEMVDRLLRFPQKQFRSLRSPEVASMIKDELEPVGGFIGDAIVQPLYLMSQVLTAMIFIFVQSVPLGLVALGVTLVQAVVIPKMRQRLLVLGRQRQLTARHLSGRIGEIIDGITSVHTNDTSNYERASISKELGTIFLIRFDIYRWKFFVKFLNNFLSQATPFIFYMFGGYFAIRGSLDIGQLVAVIAAYRELPAPLKDLIDWDLARLDVAVKYDQVVQQFDVADIAPETLQAPTAGPVPRLTGDFDLNDVSLADELGSQLLDGVSLILPLGQRVAAVGAVGQGAEYLAEILARLSLPSGGEVRLAGQPLSGYPESVTGRRLAYTDAAPFYPQSTLRDALLYPLKRYPTRTESREASRRERLARMETEVSGNSTLDPRDDWIDYDAVGAATEQALGREIAAVLRIVQLDSDVQRFGLRTRIPTEYQSRVADPILRARRAFRSLLAREGMEGYVEPFDPDRFLVNASILENIVFGVSRMGDMEAAWTLMGGHARAVIGEAGLREPLFAIGREIAETMIDIFGDLEPGSPLLRRIVIMRSDELDDYRQILMRTEGRALTEMAEADRVALFRLALNYIEPRHRLGLVDAALQARIIEARRLFQRNATPDVTSAVAFYEGGAFNPFATIQDNVLFGRISEEFAGATERVEERLLQTLDELGLSELVQKAGLSFEIGSGAKRLSLGQQQKLSLARAILKSPDYLIANRSLSVLDAETQGQIIAATLERAREAKRPFGTFWVVNVSDHAALFDRTVRFRNGRTVEEPAAEPLADERPAQVA
ncbi:ABC transporter transmembrane domain-containing protein [Antarcticirhabdus aurantiaca]|uniref:ABC transporter transmembrane domain-containing protein n=1 Tax=Antarcticirhabdus aurantiaca TaxID=2606717 RepID=A0ACD4NMV3_9HYPH|nr:ABC transporter transmembrane domain-containing protein [Antarcticirhabdus aurantiaca]WAJ28082.1 ABC transporter transmembrane domain-containing protein [Jeongeuplla avenae]